jgi:hypothetical protein
MKIDKNELQIIKKLVRANIKKIDIEVSEKELEFFKEFPEELDRITSSEVTKKIFLMIAVILGFILVSLSILIQSYRFYDLDGLLNGLVVNLLFECGVALWGASITVYLLEIIMERQDILNARYKSIVKKKIDNMD